jgi:hypothetical protein
VPAYHPYSAIRTRKWLYVRYADGNRPGLYNLTRDPRQSRNVSRSWPGKVRQFNRWLAMYTACGRQGERTCWNAGRG